MENRQDAPGAVLEFRLPDLGEGLTDAELVSWAVAVGDTVRLNQTIAEVETAKAVVSLPCPFTGRVVELLAQPGDTIPVGAPLIRVEHEQASGPDAAAGAAGHTSVLVGYGPEGRRHPGDAGQPLLRETFRTPAATALRKPPHPSRSRGRSTTRSRSPNICARRSA